MNTPTSCDVELDSGDFDPSRVAHCTFADIGTPAPDSPLDLLATLDTYLSAFAKPIKRDGTLICLKCDKPLTGIMAMFLGGGFEWGIAHGEGHCAGCRWPARAHHFVKCEDGSALTTIHNLILQYHPDYVEGRRDTDAIPALVEKSRRHDEEALRVWDDE